jgi:hypothetical protein
MAQTIKAREAKRANMQKLCDDWNAAHPVGTQVLDRLDGRDAPQLTTTRSEAQILSGHSAVIWLDGVSGYYLLDRVRAAPDPGKHAAIAQALQKKFCHA